MIFFESNLIYASFNLSSQLRSAFAFRFIDSINLVLAAFFGFVFLLSFAILLPLVETLEPSIKISSRDSKEAREEKVRESIRMKYSDMKTLIFSCMKCVFYGFIHGYFIDNNNLQYVLLIMVKIWLLFFNVKWSCLFEHRLLCVTSFIYYSIGLAIDVLCLI
jgi:hypothetical protein